MNSEGNSLEYILLEKNPTIGNTPKSEVYLLIFEWEGMKNGQQQLQ
jgi:hypothetical protein